MANYMKPIPSYAQGGDVAKDQVANVDQGERVLNPEEAQAHKLAGEGKAPSSVLGRISERAHEIYNQGKALSAPEDSEAQAFKEKQQSIDAAMQKPASTEMKPLAPYSASPMDKIDPNARYGNRGQEKRLDFQGNEVDPNTPTGMRALGPKLPEPSGLKSLPAYDEGGDVPEDQTAKLHEDEKVLDPEEAAAYRQAESEVKGEKGAPADFGGPVFPNPKGVKVQSDTDTPRESQRLSGGAHMSTDLAVGAPKMDISNPPKNEMEGPSVQEASAKSPLGSTGAPRSTQMKNLPTIEAPVSSGATDHPMTPQQAEQAKNEASAKAAGLPVIHGPKDAAGPQAPDPMDIIHDDKIAAMKKGPAGLADLGASLIHEKVLGGKAAPDATAPAGPDLVAPTPEEPKYTGMKRIGAGTPGEAEAHKQFQEKRQDYDTRIQAAMDQGTPEGDREAASLKLAKSHFEKMNPLGSAANKPGILGKIEHGLAKVGNIAGDIVAPGTMALIPGTDLNKQVKEQDLREQEQGATKESLEQAQARVAGAKTVPEQVYGWAMRGNNGKPQINPDTNQPFTPAEAQVLSTGTGKTPVQVMANELQHQPNPDTGKNYTPVEALEQAMKVQAGNKLNEHQRRVADYVSAHHMEDTPASRETARIALEKADTEAKQSSSLPFSEQKAKFTNDLSTTKALLVQQNADANARGLKADELQNTENARSSSVTSRLQTAKDALTASDDEQFAAQIVPITTLLAVTSAEGVKRVNKQELDKFVPSSGSFGRWIDAHAEQFLEGKIPTEYRDEVGHMLDRMTAAETAEHIINTRSIDTTVRQGAQQPVQKETGGAEAKPAKSEPKTPEAEKAKPAAAGSGYAEWKKKQDEKK